MPWGRAEVGPQAVAVSGSLRGVSGPTEPVLVTPVVTVSPGKSYGWRFPLQLLGICSRVWGRLAGFMTLASGGKGEGGCPELLLCPVPLFISSSHSRLVLLDSTP